MNILLTGGSGFIGKNLYWGLKEKYAFFIPSHLSLPIEDSQKLTGFLKKNKIDIVIHSAYYQGPSEIDKNMQMFVNLLKNIKSLKKIIIFGSGAEYSKTRDLNKVKEDEFGKPIPPDRYGLVKYLISKISEKEKKIIILRLFGVYGKYEDYRFKFISNSIVKNILGLPIKIKQNVVFDYLYIGDLVKIVDYFLKNNSKYNAYNITPTQSISLKQIARLINSASNKKTKISVINRGMNFKYTGDNSRLTEEISDFKFTNYKNGITELYKFYNNLLTRLDRKAIIQDAYFKKSKIKI